MSVCEKGSKADHRLNVWEIASRVGTSFEIAKTIIVDEIRKNSVKTFVFPTNQTKKNRLHVENVFLSGYTKEFSVSRRYSRNETKHASMVRKNKERVTPVKAETESSQLLFWGFNDISCIVHKRRITNTTYYRRVCSETHLYGEKTRLFHKKCDT